MTAVELDPLMSYAEVGAALGGCSERTVSRLVSDGLLTAVYVNSLPRVRTSEVAAYIDSLPTERPAR